jgi:hypothetical protein
MGDKHTTRRKLKSSTDIDTASYQEPGIPREVQQTPGPISPAHDPTSFVTRNLFNIPFVLLLAVLKSYCSAIPGYALSALSLPFVSSVNNINQCLSNWSRLCQ